MGGCWINAPAGSFSARDFGTDWIDHAGRFLKFEEGATSMGKSTTRQAGHSRRRITKPVMANHGARAALRRKNWLLEPLNASEERTVTVAVPLP
jgi:hypothetical protein